MAIAIDSQMPGSLPNNGNAIVGFTPGDWIWAFTNTAGTLLLLAIDTSADTGTITINSVTYAGAAMTLKTPTASGASGRVIESVYYLQSPATGSNNFDINWSATAGAGDLIAGGISFTGAKTGDPFLGTNTGTTASGTSLTVNLSGVLSTSYVISLDAMGVAHAGTPGNRTGSWQKDDNTNNAGNNAFFQYATGLSGTVAMTANCSGTDTITMWAGEIGVDTGGGSGGTPNMGRTIYILP